MHCKCCTRRSYEGFPLSAQLKDLTLREAVKEAAKMYSFSVHMSVPVCGVFCAYLCVVCAALTLGCSIYKCHDETKDKNFVLELSWIGEGMTLLSSSAAPVNLVCLSVCFQLQMAATRLFRKRCTEKLRSVLKQPWLIQTTMMMKTCSSPLSP